MHCNLGCERAHQTRMKYYGSKFLSIKAIFLFSLLSLSFGCNLIKKESKTPTLLKTENARQADLMKEVNRFARVNSLSAKMDLMFEDNSFAEFGMKEAYRRAPGEVVVQRPAMIRLKVQAPLIGSDIAQMTSDGDTFRVAILQDGGSGKYKKFVKGTNNADYSKLQKTISTTDAIDSKTAKQNVNAFANLRPQHFTDAMLVRPTSDQYIYTQTTIFQIEDDLMADKKSPLRTVMRGYYLLDEYSKGEGGELKIERRFWFDRVVSIRLARQQIFDDAGEIESDIVYGKEGKLTDTADYTNLPLQIQVTRPKEKYSMKLSYQTPETVTIGSTYPATAFILQNSWNLEEVDLDKKMHEAGLDKEQNSNKAGSNRFH